MGEVEIDVANSQLIIRSNIITYGNAADEIVTRRIRQEIEYSWNQPAASILVNQQLCRIRFSITGIYQPLLTPREVVTNRDAKNNYFRIEGYAAGNISFVDGIGSNSGYFLIDNLYEGSTTAAHEYGHTLGLLHPEVLDIRGTGRPGIMYPRGTLVDSMFQYDPTAPAGSKGGTLNPVHRQVTLTDINNLKLNRLAFRYHKAILGNFTNIYHEPHQP